MVSRVRFRNPYPLPDVSSEGFWVHPGPVLGDKVRLNDRSWAKDLNVDERLFAHHTLNSIRKDRRLFRTKAPNDALDLALTAAYMHNEDTLVPKMYVSMQPESLGRETWRVLRNELKTSSPDFGISRAYDENGSGEHSPSVEHRASDQDRGYGGSKGPKIAVPTKKTAQTRTQGRAQAMISSRSKTLGTSKIEARATSALARSSQKGHGGGQLHPYAGQTLHEGIPNRIERIHPSSLKLAIQGPHMDQTNAGYSRKDDGTFYGI